jgi:predicted nucleic acid-binding protein
LKICVDTTILIDILKDEFRQFQEMLYVALASKKTLVAPTVVFAELMPQFSGDTKQVASFLKDHKIKTESLDLDAVIIAGERWMKYLKRKTKAKCPNCGI